MKYKLTFIFLFLTTFLSYGQNNHLEPSDFKKYPGILENYYDNLFPLLYTGFQSNPYARYALIPSFSSEFAFSVEQKNDKYFIISNSLSKSYWYTKDKKQVKVKTSAKEISKTLYETIGILFRLLADQTQKPEKETDGFDGQTSYFANTDNNGNIKNGEIWSPPNGSPMGRLVQICDDLYLIGKGHDISQSVLETLMEQLIVDLKK